MFIKVLNAFALIFTVAVCTCLAQPTEKRRPGAMAVYGPTRNIRIERAQIINQNGQSIEGPRILLEIIKYSQDGTGQERTSFLPDGTISIRINETYARDGRILESTTSKGNGDPANRMVYEYDGNLNRQAQTIYRPDGSIANRTTFVYQDNRRLSETISYDENGVIIRKISGVLDLKTHRMETLSQSVNEVVARQSSFTDTPGGQVYEERVNGNQTAHTVNRPIGNGGGELTQYKPDGSVQSKQRVEPNTTGTEITLYNPDGSVKGRERLQTELDSHGNMVRQVRSESPKASGDFRPVLVLYQTIEYYGQN